MKKEWIEAVERAKALPAGWDSYNGHPLDEIHGDVALRVAEALAPIFGDSPAFMPVAGGVQVEWHQNGWDAEVFVRSVDHP